MNEEWRIVSIATNYEISDLGNVRRNCVALSPFKNKDGYLCVNLRINGKFRQMSVARLVLLAFVPNPENKPVTNHKNGIKTDNYLANLEWATVSENTRHAYAMGLAKISAYRKRDELGRYV